MTDGVIDNAGMKRFELPVGDTVAAIYYRADGPVLSLLHTEVPPELAGRGIATRLATAVFDELRRTGRKAVLKCPFLSGFLARHPEYSNLIH